MSLLSITALVLGVSGAIARPTEGTDAVGVERRWADDSAWANQWPADGKPFSNVGKAAV